MHYTPENIKHSSFVERVFERMKTMDYTTTQVSLYSNIKESTLKNILYKATEVSRLGLIELARALQTSVEFLATGSQAESDSDCISLAIQTPESLAVALGTIPQSVLNSSTEPPFSTLPLPKRVLLRYNVLPENIRAISINSQSLVPTLTQNDIALVDISMTRLSEGVYVIAIRDSVIIRHVSPVSKGFAFTSTNAHIYGTTVNVDPDTFALNDPDIKVVGKIFLKMGIRDL
jgi:hypothetical protein